AHRMAEGPCIEILANLANEFAVAIELEELSCCRRVRRARGVTARQYKDVTFGIDRDTRHFAQVEVLGKLQRIRYGVETNDRRRLLSARPCAEQHQRCDKPT